MQMDKWSGFAWVLSEMAQETRNVHAHVEGRERFQSSDSSECQIVRCRPMADKPLKVRRRQLNESPEKISLFRLLSRPP